MRTVGEVHAIAADIADPGDCARLFEWATITLGGLDILIDNTVGPPAGGVLDMGEDQWRRAFESILMSAVRLSRAAIQEVGFQLPAAHPVVANYKAVQM